MSPLFVLMEGIDFYTLLLLLLLFKNIIIYYFSSPSSVGSDVVVSPCTTPYTPSASSGLFVEQLCTFGKKKKSKININLLLFPWLLPPSPRSTATAKSLAIQKNGMKFIEAHLFSIIFGLHSFELDTDPQ